MIVCKHEDDYVRELQLDKRTAIWVAELTNGETVYQDDYRPGVSPHSAWLRLASYLRGQEGLGIRKLYLKFRSNIHRNILPEDAEGYFFCKSILGNFGHSDRLSFFLLGHLTNGQVMVQKWSVPELIHQSTEIRDPLNNDCLIRNPWYGRTNEGLVDRPA